jgi:hypothetical protein
MDIELEYLRDHFNCETLVRLIDGSAILMEGSAFVWSAKENDNQSQSKSEWKVYYYQPVIDFIFHHLMLDDNII